VAYTSTFEIGVAYIHASKIHATAIEIVQITANQAFTIIDPVENKPEISIRLHVPFLAFAVEYSSLTP
jgi:hypothetical protein